jgi:hypothetical protein
MHFRENFPMPRRSSFCHRSQCLENAAPLNNATGSTEVVYG